MSRFPGMQDTTFLLESVVSSSIVLKVKLIFSIIKLYCVRNVELRTMFKMNETTFNHVRKGIYI